MSGIAIGRLTEERKNWRKEHPAGKLNILISLSYREFSTLMLLGFWARPMKKEDNSTDIMKWETGKCL